MIKVALSAKNFNIDEAAMPLFSFIRKALAKWADIQESRLTLEMSIAELRLITGNLFFDWPLFLIRINEYIINNRKNYFFAFSYDDALKFYTTSPIDKGFIYLGDWVYWFIYSYIRYSQVTISHDGKTMMIDGDEFIKNPLYYCSLEFFNRSFIDKAGSVIDGSFNIDHALLRKFRVNKNLLNIVQKIKKILALILNIDVHSVNENITIDELYELVGKNRKTIFISELQFRLMLDIALDINLKPHPNLTWQHFFNKSPGLLFSNLANGYFTFIGDWIYWIINIYIKYAQVELVSNDKIVSGEIYLNSFNQE